MQQRDWFEYLKVSPDATAEQVEQAVERLSRQAAALAVTAPERSQQLRDTVRAIKRDLLSGPESRARYEAALAAGPEAAVTIPPATAAPPVPLVPHGPEVPPPAAAPWPAVPQGPAVPHGPAVPPPAAAPWPAVPQDPATPQAPGAAPWPPAAAPGGVDGLGSRIARFLRTGWTCSSCGKEAMPSDKFCTKCGTAITPTRHDAIRQAQRPGCANCSAPLGVNDAFCARCGTPVGR